jgi:hypothetical protein
LLLLPSNAGGFGLAGGMQRVAFSFLAGLAAFLHQMRAVSSTPWPHEIAIMHQT